MIEIVAVAGAAVVVLAAVLVLWARSRRLQRELSRMRVQRAYDWVTTGMPPGDAASTPEQRRRGFYLVKGSGVVAATALLAGRITGSNWGRSHPAWATSVVTIAAAVAALLLVQLGSTGPHPATTPPRTRTSSAGQRTAPTRPRRTVAPTAPSSWGAPTRIETFSPSSVSDTGAAIPPQASSSPAAASPTGPAPSPAAPTASRGWSRCAACARLPPTLPGIRLRITP